MIFHGKLLTIYTGHSYFYETNLKGVPGGIFTLIFYVLISTGTRFSIDWFKNQQIKKELQSQKLTSELQLLKSQISPHFLFNTLNNIYSLVIKKSDNAGKSILMLSNIMRYMLKDTDSKKVNLTHEIKYLYDYIELQKLRLGAGTQVTFDITGETGNLVLPPMLLITFVENAFKHGDTFSENSAINIHLDIKKSYLSFKVQNKVKEIVKDKTSGIGIQNLHKRLILLYPDKYSLSLKIIDNTHIAELKIDLS